MTRPLLLALCCMAAGQANADAFDRADNMLAAESVGIVMSHADVCGLRGKRYDALMSRAGARFDRLPAAEREKVMQAMGKMTVLGLTPKPETCPKVRSIFEDMHAP